MKPEETANRAVSRVLTYGLIFAVLWGWACSEARAGNDGPRSVAVVGAHAPEIERYAAKQLCGYLQKLYGIHAEPEVSLTALAEVNLLIGSPASDPAVARALGSGGWPKVSDQGIVLKRARLKGKPALVIGGGSPAATLWAVYELVQRWGVRYLLHGDILPAKPGHFALPARDVVMEPIFRDREVPGCLHHFLADSPSRPDRVDHGFATRLLPVDEVCTCPGIWHGRIG
jgi:hypothetical protein